MFCRYCGKKLEDSTKFCPYCGSNLANGTQVTNVVDERGNAGAKDHREKDFMVYGGSSEPLIFEKGKMMGNITYRFTHTEVEVRADKIYVHQKIRKFFFIKRQREEIFPMSSIQYASVHTKLDFWDTLYGIIFVIGGFYSLWCFLMAALCLYCGYGKVITLKMKNGGKFQIPLKENLEDAEKLIHYCGDY